MPQHELTFEEVNKHFESVDLSQFTEGGTHHFSAKSVAAAPADVLNKVCGIYRVVRPFLVLVSNFPLLPVKWREAIKIFIGLLDSICPS